MCSVETRLTDWIESRPREQRSVSHISYPAYDMDDDEIAECVESARGDWYEAWASYLTSFDQC